MAAFFNPSHWAVLRKNVQRVSELGSRSQCDEAILVMKSADDRFR